MLRRFGRAEFPQPQRQSDPGCNYDNCANTEEIRDDRGLRFTPTKLGVSLHNYDMIVVPGGFGTRELVDDVQFIEWLKTSEPCRLKVSVCTGSLLLGAAGFLQGKRATTHPIAFAELEKYCSSVV